MWGINYALKLWAGLSLPAKIGVAVGGGVAALGATTLLAKAVSTTASVSDIPLVVHRALAVETDPDVLREFAGKLRVAGYSQLADKIAGKLDYHMRTVYAPEAVRDTGVMSTWRQALSK